MSNLRKEIEEILKESKIYWAILDEEDSDKLSTSLEEMFEKRIKEERLDAYDKCQLDAEKRIESLKKAYKELSDTDKVYLPTKVKQAIKQVVEGGEK